MQVQVYDKPMCCSTGVCGPDVNPALPRFAADLDWLKNQGVQVDRYNLAQQPQAFVQNSQVQQMLASDGTDCLPIIFVDGQVFSRGVYPAREAFSAWLTGKPAQQSLPIASASRGCCGTDGCC